MEFSAPKDGRIDKLLADHLPQYSRAALAKLFDLDNIMLNGKLVKPGHKVREGAIISANLDPLNQEQQIIELPIVYEDDDVIVIDKPAGIISHARGRYWYEPSVASFVRSHVSEMSGDRAGIVHRLDRVTSGLMICAKNPTAMKLLQKQFSDRTVHKTYMAIVTGIPDPEEAIIDAPIERNPKAPSTFRVGANGKTAQTHYKVLKTFDRANKLYALVEMKPKTGRTHQLRIHMQYIHHPIVGDHLYGHEADRLLLHAYKLELTLPGGKRTVFESKLPQEFADYV